MHSHSEALSVHMQPMSTGYNSKLGVDAMALLAITSYALKIDLRPPCTNSEGNSLYPVCLYTKAFMLAMLRSNGCEVKNGPFYLWHSIHVRGGLGNFKFVSQFLELVSYQTKIFLLLELSAQIYLLNSRYRGMHHEKDGSRLC